MLVIRFTRIGKKHQPSFKIIVTDKRRAAKGGRFVEQVGFYNPLTKESGIKKERVLYWLSVGAKPSSSVFNLLVEKKVIEGDKIPSHKKAKKKEKESSAEKGAVEQAPAEKAAPEEDDKKVKQEEDKKKPEKEDVVPEEKDDKKEEREKPKPEEKKKEQKQETQVEKQKEQTEGE